MAGRYMAQGVWLICLALAASVSAAPHVIKVVDEQTGRGVPLVELETTSNVRLYTDSAGVVAFEEPGLMNTRVWFNIKSHGYEYPREVFGIRGEGIDIKDGGKTELKIRRTQVAERMYRVTGQGIYRDSVIAGLPVPIRQPLLNGGVMGQDSVQCLVYQGKIWWFWGDTARAGGPLGHFAMSGATSQLPEKGGLDPAVGVDLDYFVGADGFSRPMMDVPGDGVKWASGMMVLKDPDGLERMVCMYTRLRGLTEPLDRHMAVWDDQRQVFKQGKPLDLNNPLYPDSQPLRATAADDSIEYFYFPMPYAVTRVRAEWSAVMDARQYEAFTPLKPGTRYAKEQTQLDRDPSGRLIWAWKKDTAPLREQEQRDLIRAGVMKEDEGWYRLKDVDTGKPVVAHGGSVCWNDCRRKYVMVFVEIGGTSMLGEVWFTESDRPEGPYTKARKIATHVKQDLYNVVQHPMFDQQGGRVTFFEGTYTKMFSGNPEPTPRYEYNQLMYRLDLSDPRLKLE